MYPNTVSPDNTCAANTSVTCLLTIILINVHCMLGKRYKKRQQDKGDIHYILFLLELGATFSAFSARLGYPAACCRRSVSGQGANPHPHWNTFSEQLVGWVGGRGVPITLLHPVTSPSKTLSSAAYFSAR